MNHRTLFAIGEKDLSIYGIANTINILFKNNVHKATWATGSDLVNLSHKTKSKKKNYVNQG